MSEGWYPVPPNLPTGPMFPPSEVEAARKRVEVKRAARRLLAAAGITGVTIR